MSKTEKAQTSKRRPTFDAVVKPSNDGGQTAPGGRVLRAFRTEPSTRTALIFGLATAIGSSLAVLGVLLLAVFGHPFRSAVLMGVAIILMGALRAVWPGRPWFASRSKWWDVLAFVVVGLVILYFSPWTATLAVV